jgi:hypothetical protein
MSGSNANAAARRRRSKPLGTDTPPSIPGSNSDPSETVQSSFSNNITRVSIPQSIQILYSQINSLKQEFSNISSTSETGSGNYVTKEEFNGVMENIGTDISLLNDRVSQIEEFISVLQSNYLKLNSKLISLDDKEILEVVEEEEEEVSEEQISDEVKNEVTKDLSHKLNTLSMLNNNTEEVLEDA